MSEASRGQIKKRITTETMYTTRMTALDIISRDLESWDSTDLNLRSYEDIRLIDTSRDMAVWFGNSHYSLGRYMTPVYSECEYIES